MVWPKEYNDQAYFQSCIKKIREYVIMLLLNTMIKIIPE